jgi:hypothetical protein
VREQRVVLKYHADAPLFRRHDAAGPAHHSAVEDDLSAGKRFEARDAP